MPALGLVAPASEANAQKPTEERVVLDNMEQTLGSLIISDLR